MKYLFSVFLVLFLSACATPPPRPEAEPGGTLSFDRIEAGEQGRGVLYFLVKVQNPRSSESLLTLHEGSLSINGVEFPEDRYSFGFPEAFYIEAQGEAVAVLALDLDFLALKELADSGKLSPNGESAGGESDGSGKAANSQAAGGEAADSGEDSFEAGLSVRARAAYGSGTSLDFTMNGTARIPRCRDPRFSITSIAVSQAELINTRLRVSLKIENPNPFPVELASFSYELYGAGRFWADGALGNVLTIPPGGTAETSLALLMNFINMRRELLDQVIQMHQVNYRFKGEALVRSSLEYLPAFPMRFDLSGNSPVVR
ncbi:MAG: LEA type 2 family protein [Spirochaetaceae bacterium]|jgi:LEA14-like dessication related protein|nr:LEA type 2 family protein [Spirochaetaceae bacterium]